MGRPGGTEAEWPVRQKEFVAVASTVVKALVYHILSTPRRGNAAFILGTLPVYGDIDVF